MASLSCDEMRRRVNYLRNFGVVMVLLGSCKKKDIPEALRQASGDHSWPFRTRRVRDYDHYLVKFRTREALFSLANRNLITVGNAAVRVIEWSPSFGGYGQLGSGDGRWIQICGLPVHAWTVGIVQDFFDMHGQVLALYPSGDLENEDEDEWEDFVVCEVLLDARDWSALPTSLTKRIGDTPFKIFIDKDGGGFPPGVEPEALLRMDWNDSTAQFNPQAPAAPQSSSSSKAAPLIRPSQADKGKKAMDPEEVDDATTLKDYMALIKSQVKKK